MSVSLMYLLYSLLLTVGFLAMLPWFALDALRTRKYITGLSQRLGRLPPIPQDHRPLIWLHCVSVGETEAARPLVRHLLDRFPAHRLVISTTTVTGQRVAKTAFGKDAAAIFYFPIDWAWTVRRVLGILQPTAVLIMETELWPQLLRECRARAIPVALVNGRISITSFRRYKLIRPFIRRVLENISLALMQSDQDAARIRELGMPSERVLMPGNLKFDSAESTIDESSLERFRARFGFGGSTRLIVAASTHAPEELIVIKAFQKLIALRPQDQPRLIIAPRRPERFAEVASLLRDSGLTWSRKSEAERIQDRESAVVLLDTIGDLRHVYPLADIAFVGGSIAMHGGHNVLEPGARGVCVVVGAHMYNFASITRALREEDAIVQLPDLSTTQASGALAAAFEKLLSSDSLRQGIGARALLVCSRNVGATERTVELIEKLLLVEDPAGESLAFPPLTAAATK